MIRGLHREDFAALFSLTHSMTHCLTHFPSAPFASVVLNQVAIGWCFSVTLAPGQRSAVRLVAAAEREAAALASNAIEVVPKS